ncbi:MAG: hypothetical protein RR821_11320 [Clostridia bacterium]
MPVLTFYGGFERRAFLIKARNRYALLMLRAVELVVSPRWMLIWL